MLSFKRPCRAGLAKGFLADMAHPAKPIRSDAAVTIDATRLIMAGVPPHISCRDPLIQFLSSQLAEVEDSSAYSPSSRDYASSVTLGPTRNSAKTPPLSCHL